MVGAIVFIVIIIVAALFVAWTCGLARAHKEKSLLAKEVYLEKELARITKMSEGILKAYNDEEDTTSMPELSMRIANLQMHVDSYDELARNSSNDNTLTLRLVVKRYISIGDLVAASAVLTPMLSVLTHCVAEQKEERVQGVDIPQWTVLDSWYVKAEFLQGEVLGAVDMHEASAESFRNVFACYVDRFGKVDCLLAKPLRAYISALDKAGYTSEKIKHEKWLAVIERLQEDRIEGAAG